MTTRRALRAARTPAEAQTLRNALYALAAAVVTLLSVLGYVSAEDGTAALEVVSQVLAVAGLVLAWVKSRPKTTTTLPVGVDNVVGTATLTGEVIAGKRAGLPDGAVVEDVAAARVVYEAVRADGDSPRAS